MTLTWRPPIAQAPVGGCQYLGAWGGRAPASRPVCPAVHLVTVGPRPAPAPQHSRAPPPQHCTRYAVLLLWAARATYAPTRHASTNRCRFRMTELPVPPPSPRMQCLRTASRIPFPHAPRVQRMAATGQVFKAFPWECFSMYGRAHVDRRAQACAHALLIHRVYQLAPKQAPAPTGALQPHPFAALLRATVEEVAECQAWTKPAPSRRGSTTW